MKKLRIKIQKALNRDVIVCVRQVEQKMGLFRSIFVDETSYQELITLQRSSLILPIPENSSPSQMLGRSVIIAPCYEKEARGKTEYLVLEYGTIFLINHLLWSVNGEVEGLQDGYLLMQVSEEHPVTQKLVDAAFAADTVIAAAKSEILH